MNKDLEDQVDISLPLCETLLGWWLAVDMTNEGIILPQVARLIELSNLPGVLSFAACVTTS